MISIDRVYKTVLVLANSEIRGNVTPSDIRLIINNVVEDIYESYFVDVAQAINRQNRGLMGSGVGNWAERIEEKIRYFLEEVSIASTLGSSGNEITITLPSDLRYIDTLIDSEGNEVESTKDSREFNLTKGYASTPYPVYIHKANTNTLKATPSTINFPLTLTYLRNPVVANWAYTVVLGAEVVNTSAADYRNIDLHPSEESNVILKSLMKMGINLQEKDLQVVAQSQDTQKSNQEIIS